MLLATCVAIMSAYIDMIAFAPILGDIAKNLNVNMGAATNLMMGFVLAVACVLIWGGVVCDKYGVTAALVLGSLCGAVPATLMPLIGQSYLPVFICRLIQGGTVGFIFATIGPIMAIWFPPKEHGLASGLMIGSLSIGAAIGVVASPAVYAAVGSWQTTVLILGLPGWLAIVLALLITRRSPSPEVLSNLASGAQSAGPTLSFSKALALPVTWIGSFTTVFNAWGLYGLYNLVPPYLAAAQPMGVGLGPAMSGKLSLALTVIGIIAMIVGGIFFDKVAKGNSKPAIFIGFAIAAVFTYLLLSPAVYGNLPALVLCLMVAGWGIPFMNPSISAFIAMNYPSGIVGRMVGWWFGFGTFGGAAALYFGGMSISATGSFAIAITMIALSSVLGFIMCCFLKTKAIGQSQMSPGMAD
jgi:MFS family permease